jgi:hypothetical protein
VLKIKPAALPGSIALVAARETGHFAAEHEAFWAESRKVNGDAAGTRELVEVLLLYRTLPADAVKEGIRRALKVGSVIAEVVAIERQIPPPNRPGHRGRREGLPGEIHPRHPAQGNLDPQLLGGRRRGEGFCPDRRIGCKVTSTACSGELHNPTIPPAASRTWWYSGR